MWGRSAQDRVYWGFVSFVLRSVIFSLVSWPWYGTARIASVTGHPVPPVRSGAARAQRSVEAGFVVLLATCSVHGQKARPACSGCMSFTKRCRCRW